MLEYYEKEIGVPYPWYQYNQAVVRDFVAGGMENTTLTILTEGTLHTEKSENIRSSQSLVAHELVHQWFGDYVTCKDWSHLWLNEGFATYYEDLYDGYKNGRDSMLAGLYSTSASLLRSRSEHKPIVYRQYKDADEQFDYRTYSKAGWVLHMLRTELGEKMFRKCVKTYIERHALGCVVTDDFRSVIEEFTGRSFDRFFDQWIYHGRHPDLKVSYSWSQKDKLAKVSVEQTHKVDDNVMLFHFRTKIRFVIDDKRVFQKLIVGPSPSEKPQGTKAEAGDVGSIVDAGRQSHGALQPGEARATFETPSKTIDREIVVDSKQHDFYFALPKAPTVVRFDPDYGLLADIKFEKPAAMLQAQLENTDDIIGRLRAVDALKKKKDKKTVAALKDVLNNDPSDRVRRNASSALRQIHTNEAFDALADSVRQPDARVRQQVVGDIGGFYRPESFRLTKRMLRSEENPEIITRAIRNLGQYHHKDTRKLLLDYLKSKSYRNSLSIAAVEVIRKLDDSFFIEPLQRTIAENESQFTSRGFARALDTLAYVSRDEENKTKVRKFLTGYVNHPKNTIQSGAIKALGTLGDPKAIGVIETFSGDDPSDRTQRTARDALRAVREKKQLVPDEIVRLRETVDKLDKETEKLRNDLEDMKNRLDAKEKGAKETRGLLKKSHSDG